MGGWPGRRSLTGHRLKSSKMQTAEERYLDAPFPRVDGLKKAVVE